MLKTVENCLLGMKLMGLLGLYGSLPHTFEIGYIKEIFKVGLTSERKGKKMKEMSSKMKIESISHHVSKQNPKANMHLYSALQRYRGSISKVSSIFTIRIGT